MAKASAQRDHPPYRDTFLVPALTITVARVAQDALAALGHPRPEAAAEFDAVYGQGIGGFLTEAAGWLDELRALPDGCACCEPAFTPVFDHFDVAAEVAGRLIGDGLLQRLYGAAPVSAPQWAEALKKWLAKTDAPLPVAALIASATLDLAVPPDRRRAPAADKLHKDFDRFVKGRGAASWPAVVAAVDAAWQPTVLPWTLLLAAEDSLNAFDAALRSAEDREAALRAEAEAATRAAAAAEAGRAANAIEERLRQADLRIRDLEQALAQARREAAEARVKASRVQTALEQLTAPEDEPEQAPPPPVAADAPAPPPPAPEIEDPTPLAGERVFLFTNQEREGVRAEQAAALEALGAEVTVYFNKSLRTRAPDAFPPDVIVVSDVAFAPHAKTDEIKKRAKKSGVRYVEGKFGAGSIARAVAEYIREHRRRTAATGGSGAR